MTKASSISFSGKAADLYIAWSADDDEVTPVQCQSCRRPFIVGCCNRNDDVTDASGAGLSRCDWGRADEETADQEVCAHSVLSLLFECFAARK